MVVKLLLTTFHLNIANVSMKFGNIQALTSYTNVVRLKSTSKWILYEVTIKTVQKKTAEEGQMEEKKEMRGKTFWPVCFGLFCVYFCFHSF